MKCINKAVEISAPTMRNVLKRNSMRFAAALLVALAASPYREYGVSLYFLYWLAI